MLRRNTSSLTSLLTGFGWLVLSAILGLAMLVGLVEGTPLPPWVRALHVHAALLGGVTQIILSGCLLFLNSSASSSVSAIHKNRGVRPLEFWTLNGGLIGMLTGFWLHQSIVVGSAGILIMGACLSMIHTVWVGARQIGMRSIMESWYSGLALMALITGSVCGTALAFGFAQQSYGSLRLAHIHLILLGFIVLTLLGMIELVLPKLWDRPLSSPSLTNISRVLMPIGMAILIGGFLDSFVPLEMTAGAMLLIALILSAGNLLKSWLDSTHSGSAASDHLMLGVFFLLFTVVLGILVGINNLSSPPVLPYGKLHLAAYTHMAFVGFLMNAIMGACSYLIPLVLAADRVAGIKKQGAYLEQLTTVMNRWRTIQISTLCVGTMGLGMLAALTWNVPLTSISIRAATWTCLGLLLTSMILFSVKLTAVLSKQPDDAAATQTPPQELKLTA
jgi:hypothetical protein